MNEREILSSYQKISDLLAVNRLKESLDALHSLVVETGFGEWIEEKEELDTTYKYMLRYTIEGIRDPERQKVYQKLVSRVYRLSDRVKEALLTRDSVGYLHVQKRIFRDELIDWGTQPASDLLPEMIRFHGASPSDYNKRLSFLFRMIWLTDEFAENERNLIDDFLVEPGIYDEEKATMVSALNLSLWRYFDPKKFILLFDLFENEDDQIRYRALVGLVIAFYKYDLRLRFLPEIRNRFLLLDEQPDFKNLVEEVVIQLIRSKDTDKLTKRMQEEILPEMMKLTPQLKKKLDLDKLLKESLGEDQNPEWEEILSDSPELQGKMEELTELQMEGSDVFMSSFSMLKHFPFFTNMANWFFPFTGEHPDIQKLTRENTEAWFKKFMEAISDSAFMCNSDKYSFCYGIQSMPDDMKKFLSDGLKAESEQIGEILKDEELLDQHKKARKVIRQYAQDLYRFYKLFPNRSAFEDVYAWPLDFHNKSFFTDLYVNDDGVLTTLATFYFHKKYYPEAAQVYQILVDKQAGSADVIQKLGYCFQKQGDYEEALSHYLKADLLLPDHIWNLKKIGLCYRYLDQPEKALPYFRQAEYLDPDDLHTEVSIGHCLLETEAFEDALKSYFKVEYLDPTNHKVWRPIAWCSFVLGKFDQARKYYEKLLAETPSPFDLMNLGHLEWCQGNRLAAVERYKESIRRKETSLDSFMESFHEDEKYLIGFGVEVGEIPILLDHLRYTLED